MKVKSFVCGSALLLAVWLGVTFVHEESPKQYPNQRRAAASSRVQEPNTPAVVAENDQSGVAAAR
ncbi:MAG: hypothetical protein J0M04_15220 [Verrucomicrobia bacterium]|nr:hypothetical protein [Verrucomicrobiota bacterium]